MIHSPAESLRLLEQGDPRALARLISWVENQAPGYEALLHQLHPRLGRAHRVGITGPPGAGKSTAVERLTLLVRDQEKRVGIVAVDPTSAFTGGALLGDRVRMRELALNPGVFIRSMASRGSLGGLAVTTREVADLLDVAGFELIFLETVGVGQSELDIATAADTTVVMLVPESGDGVQAMKAGLMEIADVFAINKADRPGAEILAREVKAILEFREDREGWRPPVVLTAASQGLGIAELWAAIQGHRQFVEERGLLAERRQRRAADRVRAIIAQRLQGFVWEVKGAADLLRELLSNGSRSPYGVADEILKRVGLGGLVEAPTRPGSPPPRDGRE